MSRPARQSHERDQWIQGLCNRGFRNEAHREGRDRDPELRPRKLERERLQGAQGALCPAIVCCSQAFDLRPVGSDEGELTRDEEGGPERQDEDGQQAESGVYLCRPPGPRPDKLLHELLRRIVM